MKNRPRPAIPATAKLAVALRQLGMMRPEDIQPYVEYVRRAKRLGVRLPQVLESLSSKLGCPRGELRLDHEPALRARVFDRRRYLNAVEAFKARRISSTERARRVASCYTPNANDPDHLLYRPHSAEFEGSHHVKTNVRGDHGQFPDRVLIKRERRRERKPAKKRGTFPKGRAKIRSRPFPTTHRPLRGRNR